MTTENDKQLAIEARKFIGAYLAWSTCHHAMCQEKQFSHVVTETGIAFSDDSIHRLRAMGEQLSKLEDALEQVE